MVDNQPFRVYIGYDNREPVAAKVLQHSLVRRTYRNIEVRFLDHRQLRSQGIFRRPWEIEAQTGNFRDLIDGKAFSTEFSHTRFLVPYLNGYQGWALFLDCDMIFQTDIGKLIDLCDPQYAVQCVKHTQLVKSGEIKMDNRPNESYRKKNWSSFMLFNCAHPANRELTPEYVGFHNGGDLHGFNWLGGQESLIGSLPKSYNYIPGVSPLLDPKELDVIHYTFGGPWFENCREVALADKWNFEYEHWQREADHGTSVMPTTKYDGLK